MVSDDTPLSRIAKGYGIGEVGYLGTGAGRLDQICEAVKEVPCPLLKPSEVQHEGE